MMLMKLIPTRWVNVITNLMLSKPELTTPQMKSPKLPWLSKLSEQEREFLSKTSPPVNKLLSCSMNKKLLPELRELKIALTSLPDKNKPNLFLMPLKLSFPNLKLLLLTLLLKPSWSLPNLVLPTQLPLLLKLLLPLMVMPLTDASLFSKISKLISLNSLVMMLKMKSKLQLILIDSWLKLLPWEKPPKKSLLLTKLNWLKLKPLLLTKREDLLKTPKNLKPPPLVKLPRLKNVIFMMLLISEILLKDKVNSEFSIKLLLLLLLDYQVSMTSCN